MKKLAQTFGGAGGEATEAPLPASGRSSTKGTGVPFMFVIVRVSNGRYLTTRLGWAATPDKAQFFVLRSQAKDLIKTRGGVLSDGHEVKTVYTLPKLPPADSAVRGSSML